MIQTKSSDSVIVVTQRCFFLTHTTIIDAWVEIILQKELRTFQNVYQYEGRLLLKIKELLAAMGTSQLPLTDGFKDVSRDYLGNWDGHRATLARIKEQDVAAFNAVARDAGVAEVRIP